MFITLEGPEGSGKTSHIKPLAERLTILGYKVFTTREPGGTPIGEKIREVIHDLEHTDMHLRAETLLYQATRAQLVEQVIRPKLRDGFIGISDRYVDSTLVYQGYGYQQDLDEIRRLVNYATGGLMPDLTILLDIDVEIGLQRKLNSGEWNRLDAKEIDFHRRVREGYLRFAEAEPARWVVVDAGQSWEVVQGYMRDIVSKRIQELRAFAMSSVNPVQNVGG
ncbi:MAG: dTMP kinase [Anaerolineales bacterium]